MRVRLSLLLPFVLVVALIVVLLIAVSRADSQTVRTQDRPRAQLSHTRSLALLTTAREIGAYRQFTWTCEDELQAPRSKASTDVWSMPRSVPYRRWVRDLWKGRYVGCSTVLKRRTLPATNDWQTAVRIVQRVYPGTASWMLSISDREGGYGDWVWYRGIHWHGYHIGNDFLGADTVGGWMQFRYSTFEPYWRAAQQDLRRRGFIIPELRMPAAGGDLKYLGWLNPLGQALTAGYMRYYGKDGCHWCL